MQGNGSWFAGCVMSKRFDTDKLEQLMAPHGFVLNLPEVMKNGISFVRTSRVERLYEHILIRPGKLAYAEAVISAATFTRCHRCVSENYDGFRAFLSENSQFQTTAIHSSAAAKAWQKRLVDNADAYCSKAATTIGPALIKRLQPVFATVDSFIQKLGDIFEILDREFAFVAEASAEEKSKIDRLAYLANSRLSLNSEDAKLASLVVVRFGTEVEEHTSPFLGKVPHQDGDFGAHLILLVDHIRKKRLEYDAVGGLHR